MPSEAWGCLRGKGCALCALRVFPDTESACQRAEKGAFLRLLRFKICRAVQSPYSFPPGQLFRKKVR
jgi:hypothetical protein